MGERREERFEPTRQQRDWLDALPPVQRHAAMEMLTGIWYLCRSVADSTDNLVNLMIPHQLDGRATDFLTSMALRAEGLRALARGDRPLADEHFEAAKQYAAEAGPLRIVIKDDRDDYDC